MDVLLFENFEQQQVFRHFIYNHHKRGPEVKLRMNREVELWAQPL